MQIRHAVDEWEIPCANLHKMAMFVFKHTAHLLGYELNPVVIPSDLPTQKKISKALWARGIRGIIVSPITQSENASIYLEWKHFAYVEIGATIQNVNLHRVERGFYDDLLELYETLHAQGYRRIGIALTESRLKFMRQMPEATAFLSKSPSGNAVCKADEGFHPGRPPTLAGRAETRRHHDL